MKRIAVLIAAAAAVVAIPGGASASTHGTTCSYAEAGNTQGNTTLVDEGGVVVYEGGGMSGSATAVGACAYSAAPIGVTNFHGGTAEVGVGSNPDGTPGVYAIVDGDNANSGDPLNASDGYLGVSNYETSPPKGTCSSGTGTNSGGCFQVKGVTPELPIPLIACGNTTGPTWDSAGRDGCAVP